MIKHMNIIKRSLLILTGIIGLLNLSAYGKCHCNVNAWGQKSCCKINFDLNALTDEDKYKGKNENTSSLKNDDFNFVSCNSNKHDMQDGKK